MSTFAGRTRSRSSPPQIELNTGRGARRRASSASGSQAGMGLQPSGYMRVLNHLVAESMLTYVGKVCSMIPRRTGGKHGYYLIHYYHDSSLAGGIEWRRR